MKQCMKFFLICLAFLVGLFRRKKRPPAPGRIFILASGYLGDTFWAVQTIPLLKKAYPEAELYIGGRPFVRELCHKLIPEENQFVIHSVVSDRVREKVSFSKIFHESRMIREKVKPDLIIDLVCNRYSALFSLLSGAYSAGLDIADEFYPFYSSCGKQSLIPNVHLAFRPLSIVSQFLGEKEEKEITLAPPIPRYGKEEILKRLSIKEEEKIIMLIPGAGWEAKRWHIDHFRKLGSLLAGKYRIVLSGAGSEKELCENALQGIPNGVLLCDDLGETISLLPHCAAVVGNDSGVVHLAAAFGVKVYSFFCQTNPAFCGALGKDSHFFRAKCPHTPGVGEHFCCGGPFLHCKRGERMLISPERIASILTKELEEGIKVPGGIREKEEELISVIVSVYNGEKYLEECLDSLKEQTYKNLEIIVLDDGSTDGTLTICKEAARKDPRIQVIHFDDRKGQGARRNYGIDIAKGRFIGFVDGDDAAHPRMFENLHNMMEMENIFVAACNLQVEKGFVKGTIGNMQLIDGMEATRRFLIDPGFGAFSCNKLFRRDFLRKTGRYPEGMFYEDIVFIPQVCAGAESLAVTDESLYYYRQHNESVTRSRFSPAKMDQVKAYDLLLPTLLQKYSPLSPLIYEKAFFAMMGIYNLLILDGNGEDFEKYGSTLLEKAKLYRKEVLLWKAANHSRSFIFSIGLLLPRLYRFALKLMYISRR